MTVNDWAALILAVISILGSFVVAIRWLVKHFLNELKPNGGTSIKDKVRDIDEKVDKLESRVDEIYRLLVNRA